MILVIAGHVFSQNQFSATPGCTPLWQWIYIFHMPLFVFISGYFSTKKDRDKFLPDCWKLIEPLILFQLIARGYDLMAKGTISFKDIFVPWWSLWYLLSLLYWRIMLQILPDKILQNTRLLITCTFAVSIIASFLPVNRFMSLQRTFSFLPFFFLGYSLRGKNLSVPPECRPLSCLFLALTVTLPVLFPQCLGDLNHANQYRDLSCAWNRVLVFGLSVPMSMAFINICPHNSWTARQGRLTLQYYIIHSFMIAVLAKAMDKFDMPVTLFSAISYTMLITAAIGMMSYLPSFSRFTNPSSLFRDRDTGRPD